MSNQPFIRVPKEIFNLKISIEAKYIYQLMLDRYKLSVTNNWFDDKNNLYYIHYTIKELEKATGIGNKKVCKLLQELEDNKLILKKRQGQGQPSKIYLLNNIFTSMQKDDVGETQTQIEDKSNTKKAKQEESPEISQITETFERLLGRKPDKSFKTTIEKRLKEKAITKELLTQAIEKAYKSKAKNPEAFILYLLGTQSQQEQGSQPEPEQNKQETTQQELEKLKWYLEIAESMGDDNLINTYKKMIDDLSHSDPLRAML